jgi:hypothetical protein
MQNLSSQTNYAKVPVKSRTGGSPLIGESDEDINDSSLFYAVTR